MNAAHSLLLAAAIGAGGPPEPSADASRYSFVDVYRATVSGVASAPDALAGASTAGTPAYGPALRLAAAAPPPAGPRFVISADEEPQAWLLVLSGLALAGWVAHRRLVHPL